MEKSYKIKQIIIFTLIIIIIGAIALSISPKKEHILTPDDNSPVTQEPIKICYYRSDKTTSGYYDVAFLKLNIIDNKITGEFQNLPAEKDSKVGTFEGTVGPLEQQIMARRATVWWNSFAEGMNVKEELVFQFGDGSATVGFGEMIDRGDGVYVYKNKTNLTYIPTMSQVDCETLDEKLFTEKYVRDNIGTIATNKPVLGGTWYVTSVTVNANAHTGEVTYEDGHIQSKANFIYNYTKSPQNIEITKFEVVKA